MIVYDLDGDGKAEVALKTAPGTIDGTGNYVILPGDNPTADYRNSSGYILSGPEYLTIFDGATGRALTTIPFLPARGNVSDWGDTYGNRCDRFLAGVAYLDGTRPSLIECRGYYGPQSGQTKAKNEIVAYNYRNGQLTQLWMFEAAVGQDNNINSAYVGQGDHALSIADVDGDGKDEIIYGSAVIDDNGQPIYTTGLGHGDAMDVGVFDPVNHPGVEESYNVHEDSTKYGNDAVELHNAATGQIYWSAAPSSSGEDVGRGRCDNIIAGTVGAEMWSANDSNLYDVNGNVVGPAPSSDNFLVWWDSDLSRELEDGTSITKYSTSGTTTLLTATGCASNNGTKATPCLVADILGDWREEVVWRTADSSELRIYTTTDPEDPNQGFRIYTLMDDPQYRESIAWQNVAYNQPAHTSFYLGYGMSAPPIPNIYVAQSGLVPPSAPTGLAATVVSSSRIDLAWTAGSGAASYSVKRSDNSGGPYYCIAAGITDTNYSDNSVASGGTYFYVVSAISASGESDNSAESEAQIPLISPWTAQDIGSVGLVGRTMYSGGVFTQKGSAAAGGAGDAFQTAWQNVAGDGSIIADVLSLDSSTGLAGVTYRSSLTDADPVFAEVAVTPNNRVYFYYRASDDGAIQSDYVSAYGPQWVQLTRIGNDFTAYYSGDGINWARVGATHEISTMPAGAYAGLMTTASSNVLLGTAMFSDVSILAPGTNSAPTIATAASATPNPPVTSNTTLLNVLGADDLGEGNLTYTWSLTGTPPGAVIFSDNGDNSAKNTIATFHRAGTYHFLATVADAAGLSATSSVSVTINDLVLTSIVLGQTNVAVNTGATYQFAALALDQFGNSMGIQPALTWSILSGKGSIDSTGLYTAPSSTGKAVVQVSGGGISTTTNIDILGTGNIFTNDADIGSPTTGTGSSSCTSAGVYTVKGYGTDVWNASDQFHYLYTGITGDSTIIAQVTSATKSGSFTKDGLMMRNSTAANSAYAFVMYSPGRGVTFHWRTADGVNASSVPTISVALPVWLKLVRSANNFSAYYSTDGSTWTQIGATRTIAMSVSALAGLAASSCATTTTATTATFSSVSLIGQNAAPTVSGAAGVSANPVSGTTADLSVAGADDGDALQLIYIWNTAGTPPAPVEFSDNGTNAAQDTTATFAGAGQYTFQVTIIDVGGLTATSSVNVDVDQVFTSVIVTPAVLTLNLNQSQQFTATANDQFGDALNDQPQFIWKMTGGLGALDITGMYKGPANPGSVVITAAGGSFAASALVSIVNAAPIVAADAAALPNLVTGKTANLSVSGDDDGGAENLIYTWSVLGPAPVGFSLNSSNEAKNTVATFAQAGNYTFLATIADADGLTATSSVGVTVRLTGTIERASGQSNPTSSWPIHYTVVFNAPVSDFGSEDVDLSGTAEASAAVVTPVGADGKTYDVAVSGMTGSGTVIVGIPEGAAHDADGNSNMASTSGSVNFAVSGTPNFQLTGPASGNYAPGQAITITWAAGNVPRNSVVTLCLDKDTRLWDGNERWIEVDKAAAVNGNGSYTFDLTGFAPGKYYVGGYLYNKTLKTFTYSGVKPAITIPAPAFTFTGPASGTFAPGQALTITWTAADVPANGVISLCLDRDRTLWNGNERWIEIDKVTAANGNGSYTFDTAGLAPGKYFVGGYIYDKTLRTFTNAELSTPITVPMPTFSLTGSSSGTFAPGQPVTITWDAENVSGNQVISLCLDRDQTLWNGNERWIEVDGVCAADGCGTYTFNTAGIAAGTYYVGGYMYDKALKIFINSHLSTAISIVAPAFTLTGPASGTYVSGQPITITWKAANVSANSVVSLCFDEDTKLWNGNEQWIEVDKVAAANGSGSYTFDTSDFAAGNYYIGGYMYDTVLKTFTYSHLAKAISLAADMQGAATRLSLSGAAAISGEDHATVLPADTKKESAAIDSVIEEQTAWV